MKFVGLAAAVVAAILAVQAPAHANLMFTLHLASGPGNSAITSSTVDNYGFGANGSGTLAVLTATYFVKNGSSVSNLNDAPVAILFVIGPNGQISTYTPVAPASNPSAVVGAYDGDDDTQIGVLKSAAVTLTSLKLTGPAGFAGFDDDGIGGTLANGGAASPTNTFDDSDGNYGGPMTFTYCGLVLLATLSVPTIRRSTRISSVA